MPEIKAVPGLPMPGLPGLFLPLQFYQTGRVKENTSLWALVLLMTQRRIWGLTYGKKQDYWRNKRRKRKKKKKIPQRRGGPHQDSYWSCNDEVWGFFKTGLSHIHPDGCGLTVLMSESHSVMSDSLQLHGLYSPGNSPGQNTEVDSISLLQVIVPTQGSSPGLPNRKQILHQLSHNGSPQFWLRVAHYITTDFIVHVFLIIQSAIIRCKHV